MQSLKIDFPIQEGESLDEFVAKANNPEYVKKVKAELGWLAKPGQLAIINILGRYIFVNFEANETLDTLKDKIECEEGVPPARQRLSYFYIVKFFFSPARSF